MTPDGPPARPPTRRFLDAAPSGIAADGDPFRPLEPHVRIIQFGRMLSEPELEAAGALIRDRPDVCLRVYPNEAADLSFLRHFRGLGRLDLAIFELGDLSGLEQVADTLTSFHFRKTRRTFPLGFLRAMPALRDLHLEGHRKGIEVLGDLTGLTDVSLRSISLPDLSLLLPIRGLRELSLRLGGTRALGLLPRFEALELLDLMRVKGLTELSVLAEMKRLRTLGLDGLPHVAELPSLAPLEALQTVILDSMTALRSLEPVAAAPGLRRLEVIGMAKMTAASFTCLLGHPRLERLFAAPGGAKAHREIKAMFPGVAV